MTYNKSIFGVTLTFILVFFLGSCKTTSKIEYRDVVVDNYITKEVHDTLKEFVTDSVFLEVITKGDTVYKTKYKEKIKWKEKIVERTDTCWRDSIITQYKEITKEVKRIPTFFWICFVISSIILTFAFAKFILWIKTRSWI